MRTSRRSIFAIAFLAIACKDKGSASSSNQAGPDQSWAPAKLTSVAGVPEAEVEAALHKRLEAGAPAKVDKHKWDHARRLYKMYGDNPLWLAPDGLIKDRSFALTNAVLNAENDGLRMDAYPIGELAESIAALRSFSVTATELCAVTTGASDFAKPRMRTRTFANAAVTFSKTTSPSTNLPDCRSYSSLANFAQYASRTALA